MRSDVVLTGRSATLAVAIVSGGGCGIGREMVRSLAWRSYAIVVVYLDDQQSADDATDEILASDGMAVAVRADLGDQLDVERLFDETDAAFGGVDAVIHTTPRAAPALYEHAAQRLRRGGVIVSAFAGDDITPGLARRLGERDITVNGVPAGLEAPGEVHRTTDLLAVLDEWRGAAP